MKDRLISSLVIAYTITYFGMVWITFIPNPLDWSEANRFVSLLVFVFIYVMAVTYPGWD